MRSFGSAGTVINQNQRKSGPRARVLTDASDRPSVLAKRLHRSDALHGRTILRDAVRRLIPALTRTGEQTQGGVVAAIEVKGHQSVLCSSATRYAHGVHMAIHIGRREFNNMLGGAAGMAARSARAAAEWEFSTEWRIRGKHV
jgi:hypothetical protein